MSKVIPEAAVVRHSAGVYDNGRWGCTGCDWTGNTVDEYWDAHETRQADDNTHF